jgi:DNA-binding sugar fermentation-stimulating protein
MHAENRYKLSRFDFLVSDPAFCDVVVVVVEADGSCATPAEVGLFPQPAAVTARSARPMRMAMRRMGGLLCKAGESRSAKD